MIRLDFNTHDALIELGADPRRGIAVSSTFSKANPKAVRTALQLPRETSAHGLLLAALSSTLQSNSSKGTITRLTRELPAGSKPRVIVVTDSADFAAGLTALLKTDRGRDGKLRAGKNFVDYFLKVARRWNISVVVDTASNHKHLIGWAIKTCIDPKSHGLPAVFAPVAASTVVKSV